MRASEREREERKKRARRWMRRGPDRDRTERGYLLYVSCTAQVNARARMCACARARALFFFVLCSRLHPCVKFLPGILPSSVRSRRSIASFPPSDTLFLPRSPSWPVRLGRTEGSPAPTNRALGAFGSHRIAPRRAADATRGYPRSASAETPATCEASFNLLPSLATLPLFPPCGSQVALATGKSHACPTETNEHDRR